MSTSTQKETLLFPVSGLVCNHCVQSLTRALETAPGVIQVQVTLSSSENAPSEAKVTFDAARTSPTALAEIITDTGFEPGTPRA